MSKTTFAIKQGPRPYQEDRHHETYIPARKWKLLAVMDGHGGSEVSDFCEKNIFRLTPLDSPKPEYCLSSLVSHLNSATRRYQAGSTFSGVIISEELDTATIAILGDSPVVVLDSHRNLHISPEHNVRTNLKERKAAEERGGFYTNGYMCRGDFSIQMSRALGDTALSFLSKEPEIYTVNNPVWVLVASDGLFDPSHSNTEELLKEIKRFAEAGADANTLMAWAEKRERGLEDNATAVVWIK